MQADRLRSPSYLAPVRVGARPAWVLAATLLCTGAQAQTLPPGAESVSATGQRVELSHVEDDSNRIDELRVGGESRRVVVQPKSSMAAYEMRPTNGARQSHSTDRQASPRLWNLLNF